MSLVSDRLLAAAFFIPKENQPQNQSTEVLLEKAGASDIKYDEGWLWDCQWAGMPCQAYSYNELISHQLFVIEFMQSVFLGRGKYSEQENNLPIEKDGNLHLAIAFRDACETLLPEVAYIATHTYYAELEWVLKNVQRIESYNAIEIAQEAGLLYMRGIIADCLVDPPPEDAPDTMPVKEGVLMFNGQGSDRWW